MSSSTAGVYHPGTSMLHRAPAGAKLIGMLVAIAGLVVLRQWWQLLIAGGVVAVLYVWARIPASVAWAQLRPLRYLIPVLAVLQIFLSGWQTAVRICALLVVAIAVAALVTLTTRVTAMLDVISRIISPLRHLGVDPDRIALLLSITIRCLPLVAGIVGEVADARKARGLGFSLAALGAPVVIRSLRTADALGEALVARGADD